MNKLNDLILYLLSCNIQISLVTPAMMPSGAYLRANGDFDMVPYWYALGGFYKSDKLYLCEVDGEMFFIDRYGDQSPDLSDKTLGEIVTIICEKNAHWWRHTCERNQGYNVPVDSNWLPLLLDRELVRAVTETKYYPR